jgi:hypothetical protein
MSAAAPPFEDPAVEAVFNACPAAIKKRLLALRAMVFEVAASTPGVGELQETLKWGEPAYLTAQSKSGSTIRMEGLPLWADAGLRFWTRISILFRWAAGALMVCRADAFRDVGGFNQELYAADEIDLSELLKKWGRKHGLDFVILTRHPLETSARKVELYSGPEMAAQMLRRYLSRSAPLWYERLPECDSVLVTCHGRSARRYAPSSPAVSRHVPVTPGEPKAVANRRTTLVSSFPRFGPSDAVVESSARMM